MPELPRATAAEAAEMARRVRHGAGVMAVPYFGARAKFSARQVFEAMCDAVDRADIPALEALQELHPKAWSQSGVKARGERSLLHRAAHMAGPGQPRRMLEAVIKAYPSLGGARTSDGTTPLMEAARNLTVGKRAFKALLAVSDPLARDAHGYTALMHAVSEGCEAAVDLLLPASDAGARCILLGDPPKKPSGVDALMLAAMNGEGSIAAKLVDASKNPKRKASSWLGAEPLSAAEFADANGFAEVGSLIRDRVGALDARREAARIAKGMAPVKASPAPAPKRL